MRFCLGRHVYGLAAIVFGVCALVWHDFNTWQQVRPLGDLPHRATFACIVGVIEIAGGLAIQWRGTARAGATALGAIYLIFALLWVPRIIESPRVYDPYGNFFEQFSLVSGALIVYGSVRFRNSERAGKLARIGYFCFGICVVSFMFEQLFILSATASFVPKWIPPGQMFWAIATTIAFALAAIALFSGRSALLASRLLTAMIVAFGLLIWVPALFADPHNLFNWAANAENLGIAGSAWIVADFLSQIRSAKAV